MKIGRISAIAIMLCSAMGLTAGVAHAAPDSAAPVQYATSFGPDGRSVRATLENGMFRPVADGHAVAVVDTAGQTLAELPLAYSVSGHVFPIAAVVDDGGSALTLTPQTVDVAGEVRLQDVDARSDAWDNLVEQWDAGWTVDGGITPGIGAAIGGVIGCILTITEFCIPGAIIGGLAGAAIGVGVANPSFGPAIMGLIATF
ncbi:hypothetical protein [Antrihabitans sp. YC2-6]|uniref:hypothetical protein n=1 Tax=Antrihabitans sp. YC2-6 TaxID=2799498 RepID=UPI0018F430A6|nr:hypothetical protein [Antrihabitans sp. YC2-6]MBJ8348689.1 hypothetical protein [Antrihabitans sp. YC2-6]